MAVIKISIPEGTPDADIVDILYEVGFHGNIAETLRDEDGGGVETVHGSVEWELARTENL